MTDETLDQHLITTVAADSLGSDHDRLTREIDALSLHQALLDFEMANARVLDLTARLVEANARVVKLRNELDGFAADATSQRAELVRDHEILQAHATALEAARANAESAALQEHAELQALRSSTTFRIVRGIGSIVKRVRR